LGGVVGKIYRIKVLSLHLKVSAVRTCSGRLFHT